jgi:hypothetical protein
MSIALDTVDTEKIMKSGSWSINTMFDNVVARYLLVEWFL